MKNWKNKFLTLIDNTSNQIKGVVDSVNDMMDSFDWDAQVEYFDAVRKNLIKRSNELYSDFADLLKQVKESINDFSITVPFDESLGEKISYVVDNGKLVVEVTFSDETVERTNKASALIPQNCDLDGITLSVNKLAKTATVTIPKINPTKSNDVEEAEEAAEEPTPTKPKKTVKKKVKHKQKTEPTQEQTEQISERLAAKLQQNMSKTLHRAPNGRFVRREVNN